MKNFTQILDIFRKEALSERDKGYRFERLMQAYLKILVSAKTFC